MNQSWRDLPVDSAVAEVARLQSIASCLNSGEFRYRRDFSARQKALCRSWIAALAWLMLSFASLSSAAEIDAVAEIRPDFLMDSDPRLDELPPPVPVFPQGCLELWLEALARPEADMQRLAASTIALAHTRGMPGLEAAQPLLAKIVAAEGTHRATRFAAARALIVLKARTADAVLFDASQRYGGDLRQLVEPVLAQWNFQAIRKVWHERLDARAVRNRDLLLAIRGLGTVRDAAATDRLLSLVDDSVQSPAMRIAAARSAGQIADTGLERAAARLIDPPASSVNDRLCAVALLGRHRTPASLPLFVRLAQDAEPGVAAAALNRLNEIDFDLVLPFAEQALQNSDPQVRQAGANAYAARPTPPRAIFLVQLLDDPHPAVRGHVCRQLFRLAQNSEYGDPIRDAAMALMAMPGWRGQEQAALLLAALDHKPAATGMVTLLESSRGEVMIAAAWGLRKLAVAETLPAILDKASRQTDGSVRAGPGSKVDLQVAHLFEAMAVQNYAPAEPLWRRYIPKTMMIGDYSRGAAIWALGRLYAGTADAALSKQFVERLIDPAPPPLEPEELMRVRVMSAVALGRMGAVSQLDRMRRYLGPQVTPKPSSVAIRWAVKELTGEILPAPEPTKIWQRGWFLEPLDGGEAGSP